jgi:NADPH-dependent curcumin reductase CurA
VLEYFASFGQAREELIKIIQQGKLKVTGNETVIKSSIEGVPKVWRQLFEGGNQGKLITELEI